MLKCLFAMYNDSIRLLIKSLININRIKTFPFYIICTILYVCLLSLYSCSSSKFVSENTYILEKVEIKSDKKGFDAMALEQYIRQKANSKWFSAFKIPLGTYSLSGRDTTKWINRTLQKIGEKPVLYDIQQEKASSEDLCTAMKNMGFMKANVTTEKKLNGKKIKITYVLHPGEQYFINKVKYDIQDDSIKRFLLLKDSLNRGLVSNTTFTVDKLDAERKRLTTLLMNNGYYRFNKDYIHYDADTVRNSKSINITLHLSKYRPNSSSPEMLHPCYIINSISYSSNNNEKIPIRKSVLDINTRIKTNAPFSSKALQQTYNNFARLRAVRFTNISFSETPDSTKHLLDCNIQLDTNKPRTISFQPEGTNTAGDLGAAASLTYENRNIFGGSELFSIALRGAFEAITGLEGYQNQDYEEYNLEANLAFPRFVAPFLSRGFVRHSTATSELSLSYNLQNRPEFHRRVFSTAWRYRWNDSNNTSSYNIDLINLNYVHMPWVSQTFKHDYLDSVSNYNAILRYNYEDLFIMKIGFGFSYNSTDEAIKAKIETAGNVLNCISHALKFSKTDQGQYSLFNIAYAQYVKADFDYTKVLNFDTHNSLALHADFGIAYPYGNSKILPFEKRYFSGGANSVRGWSVRGLGPGKFRGTDGRIDFINQTGDMKLDMNMEFRTFLFWKLNGALFVDAGNIWTLRYYKEQDGGQFKFDEFYKQIAVAYGLGFRLNFGYFILRFDMGMKAINPAYISEEEHYAIFHPDFSRDFAFHFAVGLPF